MWWYVAACVWCTGIGFAVGLWVGWFSTAEKLTEEPPLDIDPMQLPAALRQLRTIDLRPVSRN